MANYLSPGVYGAEVDLSTSVPSVATGITAYAGAFPKGQAFKRILVSNIDQLISTVGTPTNENYNDWYQAERFLKDGSELYIVRAVNNDENLTPSYPDYVSGKPYLKGECARFLNVNIRALSETSAIPSNSGGNFVPDTNWALQDTVVFSTTQKKSMNAGVDFTSSNVGNFFNDYVPNYNVYEQKVDTYVLPQALRFIAKSIGTSGNNISISLSNDLTKGIEKPVTTLWNGTGYEVYATGSYDINDIVSYNYRLYKSLESSNTALPTDSLKWVDVSHKTNDVIHYNGNNWTSLISNNGDVPSETSSKWTKGATFDTVFDYELGANEVYLVIFEDGLLVEKFIVSTKETGTDIDGNNIFIDNVLAAKSAYLYSFTNDTVAFPTLIQQSTLSGGRYTAPETGDLLEAYNLFSNPEEFDVSVIIANETINQYCIDLAKQRGDCITIAGMTKDVVGSLTPATDIIEYMVDQINVENSYGAFYGNYIQIFDTYNSKYRWINVAGSVAGSQVRTNNNRDPWWANAGLERGQISGVTKIAFNPTKGERDLLYRNKINPIVSFPGQGNCIIWGQKTLLSRASAFDRLNVRQLFLVIEKAVNKAMKYFVFAPNDEYTRAQVVAMISPFLEDIKGRRGIYDYRVIADETINTPEVIDANILKVNILVKPTRVAEFIEIKYVATKTGADLTEAAKAVL